MDTNQPDANVDNPGPIDQAAHEKRRKMVGTLVPVDQLPEHLKAVAQGAAPSPKPPPVITAGMLASAGVAPWDIARFRAVFGESAPITVESFERAQKCGLNPGTALALLGTEAEYKAATAWDYSQKHVTSSAIRKKADEDIAASDAKFERALKQRMCDALIVVIERLGKVQA